MILALGPCGVPWGAQVVPMRPHGSPMVAPWGARESIRVKNYMHKLPIHRNAAILVSSNIMEETRIEPITISYINIIYYGRI